MKNVFLVTPWKTYRCIERDSCILGCHACKHSHSQAEKPTRLAVATTSPSNIDQMATSHVNDGVGRTFDPRRESSPVVLHRVSTARASRGHPTIIPCLCAASTITVLVDPWIEAPLWRVWCVLVRHNSTLAHDRLNSFKYRGGELPERLLRYHSEKVAATSQPPTLSLPPVSCGQTREEARDAPNQRKTCIGMSRSKLLLEVSRYHQQRHDGHVEKSSCSEIHRKLRCPMTMTMTHSEKSVQQSLEAWPYRHERRGHDPTKKSVRAEVACTVGKVCTYTLLMTVCSTSNMRETRRDKINTGCCWNKFSEFKSLDSSDLEQRVKRGQEDPRRTKKTTGKPEEACDEYRSSSVHPDRFPPVLETSLVVRIFPSVLVEAGTGLASLDCSSCNSFLT